MIVCALVTVCALFVLLRAARPGNGQVIQGQSTVGPAPFIDVTAYGARADSNGTAGSGTDDTTAINNAISACPASGCTIYFPYGGTGSYYISSALTIGTAHPSVKLIGECGAPVGFSSNNSCARIVSDQSITFLLVGDTSSNPGKFHSGLVIQDLGFRAFVGTATGAIYPASVGNGESSR